MTPDSNLIIQSDMAICWSPQRGLRTSEDTAVIDSRGYEVVTAAQDWPQLDVRVKGYTMTRPGILVR